MENNNSFTTNEYQTNCVYGCVTLFNCNVISNREGETGRSTRYPDRLHDFSVTTPRCYKDVYGNGFFPCTARLSNSFACRLLSLDL